jgi:hypothetical protein
VPRGELHAGSTPRFVTLGEPGAFGFFMLSDRELQPPFDLSGWGFTWCVVHVNPLLTRPAAMRGSWPLDRGEIALPIPGDPALVGTTLWTQWLHFSSSRLATSEALAVTTAAPGKPLDAAVITSADVPIGSAEPAVGRVNTGKLPVVRLHL